MRTIILTISLLFLSIGASAQEGTTNFEKNNQIINDFFGKYENLESTTRIEIGSAMIKLMAISLFEQNDDSSAKLLRSIKSIDILVEESYKSSTIGEAAFSLPTKCLDFEMISKINSGGEISHFYFAEHGDTPVCEFLMLVQQSDQNVVLYITGEFSVSDVSALSSLGRANTQ